MDLGLYDMDLSLFGGDLLVGLPPTSAELKVTVNPNRARAHPCVVDRETNWPI